MRSVTFFVIFTIVGSASIGLRNRISGRFDSFFHGLKNIFGRSKKVESSFKSDEELKAGIANFYDKVISMIR